MSVYNLEHPAVVTDAIPSFDVTSKVRLYLRYAFLFGTTHKGKMYPKFISTFLNFSP